MPGDFRTELEELINRWGKEKGSNTPDFILTRYLCDCLKSFDKAVNSRIEWYSLNKYKDKMKLDDTVKIDDGSISSSFVLGLPEEQ